MDVVTSVNGMPIRLTHERWFHIVENHDDLASYYYEVLETVGGPDFVVRGNKGTLKAVQNFGRNRWLVVVYKEITSHDGFIITAYFLRNKPKGAIVWRRNL